MLELHQAEWCPHSHKVRQRVTELGVPFVARQVAAEPEQRHVMRQCLIALRIADATGLDEDERAVVYYTSLLINVGCHTDAHEQAKWFGDDIALKSTKYGPGHPAVAAMRLVGSGNPPLHRFRVGLEFV